ncbi:AsmA-like C-terminal region-containing protein [Rhodocytophaga aerolata]|uniref:AsmA-like C-terminal region-containing protein n=1 Tax=Rhodocytophaga aerolata TaxID=455078 RepID=A0ABT8R5C8_9BACT|nr:AsmA-like C-terminal region-containing protein [Rhodocytophaga aerolata]MDO1447299.1 AsmA-like C-terminal region-containing protein [Rhodocytophaga aerolata]
MKKAIIYISGSILLLLTAATTIVYIYQDEIIKLFVRELNKNLQVKVDVQKIDLSLFDKFPQVALSFHHLKIHGALPEHEQPLAYAEKLSLTFDFWNIFRSTYKINEVFLEKADVQIYVNEKGEENYQIFKKAERTDTSGSGSQVNFGLEEIHLEGVQVTYTDRKNKGIYDLFADNVQASLEMEDKNLLIGLKGGVHSKYIQVDKYKYFTDKQLLVASNLIYNLEKDNLTIKPSELQVKQSEFLIEGSFENHSDGLINLSIQGKDTDVQTLVSLLPTQYADNLSVYRSKGKVYFDGQVKGATFNGGIPLISVNFGCENATFYQTDIDKQVTNAFLTGSFTNGNKHNRATSVLKLNNIKGNLGTNPFQGNLIFTNFDDPYLKFDIKGELDVASLFAFYPLPGLSSAGGILAANIDFEGKLTDLRSRSINRFVRTSGEIDIQNLQFALKNKPLQFQSVQGHFVFDKTDLQVKDLRGSVASSDFRLNGYFRNIMAYLFLRDQNLAIEAEFSSGLLDFDELLAASAVSSDGKATAYLVNESSDEAYQFAISPRLSMSLTCAVDHVKFRRFQASAIKGNLLVNNSVASSENIQLSVANGQMRVQGNVDARQPEKIAVACAADFQQLAIDSVFYMFENFNQDFILDRHLRGKVTAQVQTSMLFDSKLNMDVPALTADVTANVVNGGLLNFEPMQKLSRFIKRQDLENMQFSEMENTIRIANSTVFIPEMEIRSNVSNLSVRGTHTFDQVMDYKLKIPVYNFMGKRAREVANENSSNLFLKVYGTSDEYKIEYDNEAVKEKIQQDWKQEKQEFKNMLKGKRAEENQTTQPSKKKAAEEEKEEEFFDF